MWVSVCRFCFFPFNNIQIIPILIWHEKNLTAYSCSLQFIFNWQKEKMIINIIKKLRFFACFYYFIKTEIKTIKWIFRNFQNNTIKRITKTLINTAINIKIKINSSTRTKHINKSQFKLIMINKIASNKLIKQVLSSFNQMKT